MYFDKFESLKKLHKNFPNLSTDKLIKIVESLVEEDYRNKSNPLDDGLSDPIKEFPFQTASNTTTEKGYPEILKDIIKQRGTMLF